MKLHEDKELFANAIQAASQPKENGGLGINEIFLEKDYWICRSLSLMSQNDKDNRTIFKGGTSLTKAYGIGNRFSEDIDIAIADSWTLSGNQLKNLIRNTAKQMTLGLQEINIPNVTSKGSHYYKAYYDYPRVVKELQIGAINAGRILIEINSFANPYPFNKCKIQSFLTEFLALSGNENLIQTYDMQPFDVNVLDCKRTLTEKLVSLIRCSFAENYVLQLSAKIRHFYDLHFLIADTQIRTYINCETFKTEFQQLLKQDQDRFDEPKGWKDKSIKDSPLIRDFHSTWETLSVVYNKELPELAYRSIPSADEIEGSVKIILDSLQ